MPAHGAVSLQHACMKNMHVVQLYDEMGSRHRVRPPLINIIKTATVPDAQCKRDNTKQFHETRDEEAGTKTGVKFPLTRKMVRCAKLSLAIKPEECDKNRVTSLALQKMIAT